MIKMDDPSSTRKSRMTDWQTKSAKSLRTLSPFSEEFETQKLTSSLRLNSSNLRAHYKGEGEV